ncbi:MAG: type II toxin-antitoxin system VapC family toxin [Thiotrichales bacterium]|nr:type II toxin-antitoxin system VapC family toxin [Thiotrichales bacterium]
MNLLLDTHVALWAITDSPKLPQKARDLIGSPKTNVWVSAATIWKIAIKHSLGRGDMPVSSQDAMRYFQESGYRFLAVEAEHAIAVESCLRITKTCSTAFLWRRHSLCRCV